LPAPPNAFRGIRRKSSSLRRWLAICTDDITELVNWVRCFIIYIYIYRWCIKWEGYLIMRDESNKFEPLD
jgi:hypothetical protein